MPALKKISLHSINKDSKVPATLEKIKARALYYLSKREYSRLALSQKLMMQFEGDNLQFNIDETLNELEKKGWLSDERFAKSLVHRRAERFGSARIIQELGQYTTDESLLNIISAELKTSEFARAYSVWNKKYNGVLPNTPMLRAKQIRFLMSRGFSYEVITKVLKNALDI